MKPQNSLHFCVTLVLLLVESNRSCYTTNKRPNVRCVFPFIYRGKTYDGCTRDSDPEGKQWCATKVDQDGFYIEHSKEYGYCSEECFTKDENVDTRTVDDTRTADDQVDESDRRCNTNAICKNQNKCPSFLEQKKQLKLLQKGSREYRTNLEKIKRSICNKSRKGVCCPQPKRDNRCDGGNPCLTEDQCPHAKELRRKFQKGDKIAKRELISLICDRKERTFCCPTKNISPTRFVGPSGERDKSPTWFPSGGECGRPARPGFIVGGVQTLPGEFPFTVLLGYTHSVRNKWVEAERRYKSWTETRWKCGGTLINRWYVLTAAHCISSKLVSVRLGEWEVKKDPDCDQETCIDKVQDFQISSDHVTEHEGYRRTISNIENDVALIKLPRAATLNQGVQIVCLPTNSREAARALGLSNLRSGLIGKRPTVVGWGYTEYDPWSTETQGDLEVNNIASSSQQKLEVPVLSTSQCQQKFNNFTPKDSQICAGAEQGKDSCKGDSGGPLYYTQATDGSNTWYLLGVVSFGSRNCGNGKPGVYSRVESFVPWIKANMN